MITKVMNMKTKVILKKLSEDHFIVVDDSRKSLMRKGGSGYYLGYNHEIYSINDIGTKPVIGQITHSTQPLENINFVDDSEIKGGSMEIWKDVIGYDGYYQVSNYGRVKSVNRIIILAENKTRQIPEKILKFGTSQGGYLTVSLNKEGTMKNYKVHRLVASHFLPDFKESKDLVVDHINNIPTDNRVENLQLITNRLNCSKDKNSITGKTGVHLEKRTNKFTVRIFKNNKYYNLGTYENSNLAESVYKQALEVIDTVFNETELQEKLNIDIRKPCKYSGISYHKASNKWAAYATINRKKKYLGLFNTEEEAYLHKQKFIKNKTDLQ